MTGYRRQAVCTLRNKWGLSCLAAIAVAHLAFSSPLPAQTLPDGQAEIAAQSFEQISLGTRIRIRLADDSDRNRQLGALAADLLKGAGHVVDDRNFTLTLRMETKNIAEGQPADNSVGSLQAGNQTGVDLNVRLWSSTKNSLLKRNVGEAENIPEFVILLDAYDEVARKAAWRGEARTTDSEGDSIEVASAMIRQIVPMLGITVPRRTVPLR